MRILKKIFLISLSLILIFNLSGCKDSTDGNTTHHTKFEYHIDQHRIVIDKYIGSDRAVIIPKKIKNRPVEVIASEAFSNSAITHISIPDSVKIIHKNAFAECRQLTEVKFGKGVINIAEKAFYRCTALQKIELPENLKTIGDYAVCECSALKEIYIPKTLSSWGTAVFLDNSALISITFEEGLEKIGGLAVFQNAKSLEKVTIPKSVDYIAPDTFAYCDSLKSIHFMGNAPSKIGNFAFGKPNKKITIYYNKDTSGWNHSWLDGYSLVAY